MSAQIPAHENLLLTRLLPLQEEPTRNTASLEDSVASQRSLIDHLRHALEGERARGLAGHWSYDINRHIGLQQGHQRALDKLALIEDRVRG